VISADIEYYLCIVLNDYAKLVEDAGWPHLSTVRSKSEGLWSQLQVRVENCFHARGITAEMSETTKTKKNIEYVAPRVDVVKNFAHQVCQGLGDEFADPEIERGFADFLIVMSRILANNLNRDPEFLAKLTSESSDRKPSELE
jgi:hypothetical protein